MKSSVFQRAVRISEEPPGSIRADVYKRQPQIPISFRIEKLTGITDAMVLSAPTIETVLKEFLDFCGDAVLVAHNAEFDTSFIANKAQKQGITVNNTILDTVDVYKRQHTDIRLAVRLLKIC